MVQKSNTFNHPLQKKLIQALFWGEFSTTLLCCEQVKGEAEAFAIEAKAKAEAEQMAKKADAWKEYREAAVVDMVLETMPKVWMNVALLALTI